MAMVFVVAVGLLCPAVQAQSAEGAEPWARVGWEAAKERGVIDGYSDGSFRPNAPASRAEALHIAVAAAPTVTAPPPASPEPTPQIVPAQSGEEEGRKMETLAVIAGCAIIGLLIWAGSVCTTTARETARRNDRDEGRDQALRAAAACPTPAPAAAATVPAPAPAPPTEVSFEKIDTEEMLEKTKDATRMILKVEDHPGGRRAKLVVEREPAPRPPVPGPAEVALCAILERMPPPAPAPAAAPINISVAPTFNVGAPSAAATVPAASASPPATLPMRVAPPTRAGSVEPAAKPAKTKKDKGGKKEDAPARLSARPETAEDPVRAALGRAQRKLCDEAELPWALTAYGRAKEAGLEETMWPTVSRFLWGLAATYGGFKALKGHPAVNEAAAISGVKEALDAVPAQVTTPAPASAGRGAEDIPPNDVLTDLTGGTGSDATLPTPGDEGAPPPEPEALPPTVAGAKAAAEPAPEVEKEDTDTEE